MNETLVHSFQSQNGVRGAHFYDGENCEFVRWDLVIEFCNRMKDRGNPAHIEFEEKLIHTISNTHPEDEYVLVRQHDDTVTIECYRLVGL
jgi:hypothetical protein